MPISFLHCIETLEIHRTFWAENHKVFNKQPVKYDDITERLLNFSSAFLTTPFPQMFRDKMPQNQDRVYGLCESAAFYHIPRLRSIFSIVFVVADIGRLWCSFGWRHQNQFSKSRQLPLLDHRSNHFPEILRKILIGK